MTAQHEHETHRITHPVTGDLYLVCPCGWEINLSDAEPDIDDDGDEPEFLREGLPEFNGAFR